MNKFKIGDKAKRITYSKWPEQYGYIGHIYTVENVNSNFIYLKELQCELIYNKFELVTSSIPGQIQPNQMAVGGSPQWATANQNTAMYKFNSRSKWYINKNETLYFWDSNNKYYGANYTFQYFLSYSDNFKTHYNLSEEEIQQIMNEIKEEQNQLSFGNISSQPVLGIDWRSKIEPNGNVMPQTKLCIHEMIPYVGMKETFNYCKKCGEKEK